MLKLKRVEIQGFKSFCDRTELRFHGSGIAAIVGPNGCGKSNLSDAISWVLGEQSAKTLRGSRMEDVIFAGTRDRKPLGMAQVTLTMVDPNHHEEVTHTNGHATSGQPANGHAANGHDISHAHGHTNGHANGCGEGKPNAARKGAREITVTRRLFRSGESEYLIDGKAARLRDIQDLFMGTGLGPESYAIIEQGRIGQILSSKPYDRRAVIEEAAGISKFKARRKLAEAKLESAKQNLARVFDILEEVGRQANSLKRQAAKARRYQELHAELVVQLRLTLTGRYRLLERETARIALEVKAAGAEFQQLSTRVAELEKQQQSVQEQCYALEGELTRKRQQVAELRVEGERVRGRIDAQARQIASIESRLAQGETEQQEFEQRLAQIQDEIQIHGRAVAELEQMVEAARAELEAKSRQQDAVQSALRQREQGIESSRQQVLRLLGEASTLRNQLAQTDTYLESIARDLARVEKDEQSAAADIERLSARKAEVSEALAARQMLLEDTAERRRKVEQELSDGRAKATAMRRLLDQMKSEASRLKARKDSLEEILSHRAYTTESVKRLFTALERGEAPGLKPYGVLADFVEVDANFEKAAEEFLHEELEYVVVQDFTQAEAGIDFMRSGLDGRATFLVHPESGARMSAAPVPEPVLGPETGIAAKLSDVLRMTNGLTQAPAALLPRLARCFVAEDRTAAQRLAMQYPDYYFLLPDGVCYHGHAVSGGRKTGSGPLALKRELRELKHQEAERQKEVRETSQELEELERRIGTLSEELEKLRAQQQGQEKEALALDHEIRKLTEEFHRANSRLSVTRLEMERLRREREKAGKRREESLRLVEEKEQQRQVQEEALAEARQQLEELRKQAAQAAEQHSALRVQLAGHEERRRSEKAAQSRLEAQSQDLARRRQHLSAELERLGVERARLLADNIELDARAGELAASTEALEQEVARLAAREVEARQQLSGLEESLREGRQAAQAAQEKRAQVDLLLVERRADLKYLDETCRKELNQGVEELAGASEQEIDEFALAEAEEKYNQLKSRIESLGPVNPDALQEYEESQQRYDFLNAQRQDLLDSIRDTEKAIQEIDQESRKRFTNAFEKINANFKEIFTKLFGGGSAEMRLTDEANAADSGIDIVASPPGKRLQNVLLLSGGEKALTALSLLMAVFRFQPSPFCMLDEVDAPLDEPNIQRLMKLLQEMSSQTQFMIITHAKRTMEAANTLYGVTMQEPGVSKLVSVRFNPPPDALEQMSAQAAAV